ncbi:MAG: hypothetical protein AAF483_13575, partial [Planctomycetota bacterium]
RPKTVNGFGIAGICLIRLKHMRPKLFPSFIGTGSENAAHRVAVEWDTDGITQNGVYIPRRDTSSFLNTLAGDRLFPGGYNLARFDVRESESRYHISMDSLDGSTQLTVDGQTTEHLPDDSIFDTVAECSRFFEEGSIGYSPAKLNSRFDGLELRTVNWRVQPLKVTNVRSSFFDDRDAFPSGAVAFDNALLMEDIEHEWHSTGQLCCIGD